MADIRCLERTLGETVTWNKARRNFLAKVIIALIQVKTVSLVQISCVMQGSAKQDSHYKRCQRFLRFFDLPFAEIARLVMRLLGIKEPSVISLDRTDWYVGDTPVNILMLSVVFQGVAFPLLWTVLEKKGCSDTTERIQLLEKYLSLFSKETIAFVTADREFIGRDWFRYLRRKKLPFRIRIKENLKVTNARGNKMVAAKNLFRTQKAGVGSLLFGPRKVLGEELYLMGLRTCEGEYVIVASSDETEEILKDYAKRWKIEMWQSQPIKLFAWCSGRGSLSSSGRCREHAVRDVDHLPLARLFMRRVSDEPFASAAYVLSRRPAPARTPAQGHQHYSHTPGDELCKLPFMPESQRPHSNKRGPSRVNCHCSNSPFNNRGGACSPLISTSIMGPVAHVWTARLWTSCGTMPSAASSMPWSSSRRIAWLVTMRINGY